MKSKSLLRRLAAATVFIGLLPITNAFALSAFPTSGSCAMLLTQPVPFGATIPANDRGYNILAVLTFSGTSGTINFAETRVDYTTGGPTNPTSGGGEGTLTVSSLAAPAPSEARRITLSITSPSPGTMTANAIAVNGGNTILIQGETEAFSGVCNF